MDDTIYDHYLAIDWAANNMVIARITKKLGTGIQYTRSPQTTTVNND